MRFELASGILSLLVADVHRECLAEKQKREQRLRRSTSPNEKENHFHRRSNKKKRLTARQLANSDANNPIKDAVSKPVVSGGILYDDASDIGILSLELEGDVPFDPDSISTRHLYQVRSHGNRRTGEMDVVRLHQERGEVRGSRRYGNLGGGGGYHGQSYNGNMKGNRHGYNFNFDQRRGDHGNHEGNQRGGNWGGSRRNRKYHGNWRGNRPIVYNFNFFAPVTINMLGPNVDPLITVTDAPTSPPTNPPDPVDSPSPTDLPSSNPSEIPSSSPTGFDQLPTFVPTLAESDAPTLTNSPFPVDTPSDSPTSNPTSFDEPSNTPSFTTLNPTTAPTFSPTSTYVGTTSPAPTSAAIGQCNFIPVEEDSPYGFEEDYGCFNFMDGTDAAYWYSENYVDAEPGGYAYCNCAAECGGVSQRPYPICCAYMCIITNCAGYDETSTCNGYTVDDF